MGDAYEELLDSHARQIKTLVTRIAELEAALVVPDNGYHRCLACHRQWDHRDEPRHLVSCVLTSERRGGAT